MNRLIAISLACAFAATICTAATNTANHADAEVEQAITLAWDGNLLAALPLLEEAAKGHPFHAATYEVLYQLGLAYLATGMPDKASATFLMFEKRYGARVGSRYDDVLVAQGRVLCAQTKYDEAANYVKKFLANNPKSEAVTNAQLVLATVYDAQGKKDEAQKIRIAFGSGNGNSEEQPQTPAPAPSAKKSTP